MGETPTKTPEEIAQDEAFAKSQKSMGGRVDQDPVAPVVTEEKKDEEPVIPPKKDEEPAVVVPPEGETVTPPVVEGEKPDRPVAYIPIPKYKAEKKEWEDTVASKETALAEANKKIEELTLLTQKPEGTNKDADIEAFMEKTGFDRETVDGLLDLAKSRISTGQAALSPEQLEAVEKATQIVKEAELEVAFNEEFTSKAEPELKKLYPDATPEQLVAVKKFLDPIAHTIDNKDKGLDFIIFKNKEEIAKLFEAPAPTVDDAQPDKKTIESTRPGAGKPVSLTASDFKAADADFGLLGDLDQGVRAQIIKDFDSGTYARYIQYAKNQTPGVEVMRNGSRVILK